ncbi:hypothetical protein [Tianweitania sediminis]|jgi:hypothetical protein|uniref:Uncharacterized protein n=1 Tax=Tianweitania sediminis TaxID=1502156 RepID=A0A8J7UIY1_9HYPH|nr:hypothetical protein [Tianweitania sediminis]MBP0438119.1 hypothetical protein [Tianweitania sediminis]HEV7418164.1 hypothetical protein [Tianweitania sediminis]
MNKQVNRSRSPVAQGGFAGLIPAEQAVICCGQPEIANTSLSRLALCSG